MAVLMHQENNVGYVTLDNPPVNAMGLSIRQGLQKAVKWAEDLKLERVILTGKGSVFAAGGDAKEFDSPPVAPHLPDVLNAIESSFVPWIAAVNGAALGGGLELMLACKYRIVSPHAKLGLPEVNLGVIPGAGGTQRLARLVGFEKALEMITSGKPISAREAKSLTLIDEIDEDPIYFAEMTNPEWLGMKVAICEMNPPEANEGVFNQFRDSISKKMKGQIAPLKAIDSIENALSLSFYDALEKEREIFLALRNSDQAKALRHIFFAERAAKAPEFLKDITRNDFQEVAVIGGGTMGAAIAYALLSAAYHVKVIETDIEGVERASNNIEKLFAAGKKRGLITPEKETKLKQALIISNDYEHVSQCGIGIEAAFEDMEVKKAILQKLETHLPKEAILATNTSYLDINEMAECLDNPERLVGLHFFAPAHIMKLLEIVRGDKTSDQALKTGFELAQKLRKIPVLAGVCDGFIGNRIYMRYREMADMVFMDGSTPWDIDNAMVDFGYAMGPYETQDLSGLDIAYANRRRQDATRDPNRRYVPIADRMVELGKLGRKTGAGWYRYTSEGGKIDDPIVADLGIEEAHFAGITRVEYSQEEIQHRLLLCMINEAADILKEGIAQSAQDIDLVSVFGYGFPRWRGGLMHYADQIGAKKILADLRELEKEDAIIWKPSELIVELAKKNQNFASV